MKSLKNYLESGGYAIVSCKDRNNKNFQIWGALSDLNCGRKKTKKFKEWLEMRLDEDLTDDQNQTIKQFYIILRDTLYDLKNQIIKNGFSKFDHEDGPTAWVKFCGRMRTDYRSPKDGINWAKTGCGIEIELPEEIKNLSNVRNPFYLRFPYEEDEIGGLALYPDGTTNELRINLKYLMLDFEGYKGTIQHELQHIIDKGVGIDYEENNLLLRTIKYQCQQGEIAAFAKEWAYRYYKLYPTDTEIDLDKFKKDFYRNSSISLPSRITLDNYINFGIDSEKERITKKYNMGDEVKIMMQDCNSKFIEILKKSFLYYKVNKL